MNGMVEKIKNNYDNLMEEDYQVIGDGQEIIYHAVNNNSAETKVTK